MTLDEFLNEYVEFGTPIEVSKCGDSKRFLVSEFFNNPEMYKEFSDREIDVIGVEDNAMVIYVNELSVN